MKKAFLLIISMLLLSCNQPNEKPVPTTENKRLRIGMRRAPDTLNPYMTTTYEGEVLALRFYPSLFREKATFKDGLPDLEPRLVDKVVVEEDGRRIRLTLLDNLSWSDGKPLTAEDVAYSLQIQRDPEVAWLGSDRKENIASWKVSAALVIEVDFHKRSPFNLLDLNEGFIIPKHYYSQFPIEDWKRDWSADLVVFGPYGVESMVPGQQLVLKNLDPKFPKLGIAFVRERETLFQMLLADSLDYAWPLPTERIPEMSSRLNPTIFDDLGFAFIAWNSLDPDKIGDSDLTDADTLGRLEQKAAHPIFSDVRVRRALSYAANRADYIHRFWHDRNQVPANPWQLGLYYHEYRHQPLPYEPETAARLLDEAGWRLDGDIRVKQGRPLRFKVVCNVSKGIREQYLLALQQDFRQLGIDMEIDLQEASLYMQNCLSRNFDAVYGLFKTGTRPDIMSLYQSTSSYNYPTWTSVDDLLQRVHDSRDRNELSQGISELTDRFQQDQPVLMLFKHVLVGASRKGLNPKGNHIDPLSSLDTWWETP